MLDGLLNRGFSSKCKSVIKDVRRRLEEVRRRAEAKQRILKEDLVKLLANGLDINAYGRTEEFLAGLNLLSCYDFIEYTCEYIVKLLSGMQKQRECPEDCREAVASLMFAAARFSYLPELRDLRDLFQERYRSELECFVNQKFLEKLSSVPPTAERRLQLLQDIATEFSIKWDYKGFEQRMAGSSTYVQVQSSEYGLSTATGDKCSLLDADGNRVKSNKFDASPISSHIVRDEVPWKHSGKEDNDLREEKSQLCYYERPERRAQEQLPLSTNEKAARSFHRDFVLPERQEARAGMNESLSNKDDNLSDALKSCSSSGWKRLDMAGMRYKVQSARTCDFQEGEDWEASSLSKVKISPSHMGPSCKGLFPKNEDISSAKEQIEKQKPANSDRTVQKEDMDSLKASNTLLPPPYVKSTHNAIPPRHVKPKEGKQKATRKPEDTVSGCDGYSLNRSPEDRIVAVGSANWKQNNSDNVVFEGQKVGHDRLRGHENEQFYEDNKIPLPRPRSVRRKQHKSSAQYVDLSRIEGHGAVKRTSSSRRKESSRKGLHIIFDDENHQKDEEERIMDKLLLHYSKKPSTHEVGEMRRKPESHRVQQIAADSGESCHDQSGDGHGGKRATLTPSMRSISMPHEQTATTEATKVFNRANSFQPGNRAPHVHPKLPEYDDLAARFAALRGL